MQGTVASGDVIVSAATTTGVYSCQGSHASWKVLYNDFGPGKSWKFLGTDVDDSFRL